METKLSSAVRTVIEALREDPEYRFGWKANIAMAFYDEFLKAQEEEGFHVETPHSNIHRIANRAADNFLNLLTRRD